MAEVEMGRMKWIVVREHPMLLYICTETVRGQTQSEDGEYTSLNGQVTLHRRVQGHRERGSHFPNQSILHLYSYTRPKRMR